jgi:hypothetical protein
MRSYKPGIDGALLGAIIDENPAENESFRGYMLVGAGVGIGIEKKTPILMPIPTPILSVKLALQAYSALLKISSRKFQNLSTVSM